ncbi:MAG: DUF5995 family protein [Bacteroidales bacterium]|nr:DUF5995 family protein [Bacteroidales bacterium]MCF8457745.1 DUF5995 family protein [Bacteroidales bacterium]
MIAKTIDEVIENLEQIIQASINEESPLGYFAALYQKVTIEVKAKLGKDYFDDDKRMEQLDVVFANRYLLAWADYKQGDGTTKSWELAFSSSKNKNLIVLQQLLFGMNAHINLDLGIAASEVTCKSTIQSLHSDFNKINKILASLVDEVQKDLSKIWPTLHVILKLVKKADDLLVDFAMTIARDGAWKFANELIVEEKEGRESLIFNRDKKIAKLSKLITGHGILVRILLKIIRWGERGKTSDKIRALEKVIDNVKS